jgi:hypothetical protein
VQTHSIAGAIMAIITSNPFAFRTIYTFYSDNYGNPGSFYALFLLKNIDFSTKKAIFCAFFHSFFAKNSKKRVF